ncbi:hypothetical protein A3J78_01990 [Candidatus Beckwithbacteria bacterium RBG_13_35_6]|uniref:ParB-like N-terminal domain-containing protein n=1 Tax=Candidatus Beckwithbacteria bacterium RBG_13_35_6 TaxID=1797456 RepID=A0A1F5DFW7_9BACT|nr:MAG: hypothetical protein A3J78_01990 [Candidatus Beckwithbacteria bacterium RBG_13_35_6]
MNNNSPKENSKITYLAVDQLQPNPKQPRGIITPENIMELTDSIKEHGVLEPLIVAHTPAGYQIIAGERRWRAAKMSGLKNVPCIIKETSPKGMLEMTLVENVQREDLNPLEKAKAFQRLREEFNLGTGEIAKRIGKSSSYISNTLRLLELPDAIKDGLLSSLITEGHARALQTIDDVKQMIEAYKMILRESASVRRAEDIARKIKVQIGQPMTYGTKRGQTKIIASEETDQIQNNIREALGNGAKVKIVRTIIQTRINIILTGNPEKTEEKLQEFYKKLTDTQ